MEISNNGEDVTSFESICAILGELWMDYKSDKYFKDFIEYNDIGLPIAFLIVFHHESESGAWLINTNFSPSAIAAVLPTVVPKRTKTERNRLETYLLIFNKDTNKF